MHKGLELFFDHIFEYPMLKTDVCIHLLKPPILLFQLLQAFDHFGIHPTVLVLPVIEGALADTMLLTNIGYTYPSFVLLEDFDDLTLCEF